MDRQVRDGLGMSVIDTPPPTADAPTMPFALQRLGTVMRANPDDPREAWGVLNPGGVRGPDGDYYLFPRLVAEGNFSRIGRARVLFDSAGDPTGVERLGCALEPREPYECSTQSGGVEDPRVTYLRPLGLYAMTYTAYAAHRPRIALAVSPDLVEWQRLGLIQYTSKPGALDLNNCINKDGMIFPDVVADPLGRPALALIHRPTPGLSQLADGNHAAPGVRLPEAIWISYAPLDEARADLRKLTHVGGHRVLLAPLADWEAIKIGGGAPPVRLSYGWLLLYHGVSVDRIQAGDHRRYCAGAAILDLDDPTVVLYRSSCPILEPETGFETDGVVPNVVFPTAADQRGPDRLDVYYGAADTAVGVARMTIPPTLPTPE